MPRMMNGVWTRQCVNINVKVIQSKASCNCFLLHDMSSLYRVLSPAQWSSLFINYTKDLLLVSNASVIPKAKCFPGEKFPEEQA